jgi:hypothetical protein
VKPHKKCPCGKKCVRSGDHRKHACNAHNRFDEPTARNARTHSQHQRFSMPDIVYKAKGIFGPWDHGGR